MAEVMEVKHNHYVPLEGCFIETVNGDTDMDTLKRDLFRSRQTNVGLQLENSELQRYVQDLEAKLQDVYQETQLQVGDLTDMLDDTQDKIKELETSYDVVHYEEKIESESQLKHTERRLLSLCDSLGQTQEENDALEKKLGDAQNQIQKVEGELNLAIKTKSHLTKQLEDTEDKVQILRQEVSLLQKIGLERQKNLKWCEKEVRSKQNVASELITNSCELRKQNDQLNKAVNNLQDEVEDFQKAHVLLQEQFFQTQNVLDEVQSGYKMMADERAALSEELQLFYEKHQEVRSDYQLCMYEKHEKEQEIALLKQHLERIERDMYEMTKTKCGNCDSNSSSGAVSSQETSALQDANGYQGLEVPDDEGIVLNHDGLHSAKDIDIERPLRELSTQNGLEEEVEVAPLLDSHTFREPDSEQLHQYTNEAAGLTTKAGQLAESTRTTSERKQLGEIMDSFQRGWMEAIKLKSFREEQVKELLSKVARLELQTASLKDQNNHLQQRITDLSSEPCQNGAEPERALTTDKKEGPVARNISSDMPKAELIHIIQKLDSELEETKEDLLTARVFNDNFVEYKVKLCRKFRKEESKLYSQEKELCRSRAENLRLQTEITLYKVRLDSMTARLNSALSERDRYEKELRDAKKL